MCQIGFQQTRHRVRKSCEYEHTQWTVSKRKHTEGKHWEKCTALMTCGSIASGLTYKLETQGMGRYKRCLEGKKKDIWRNNELNFYKFDENWKQDTQ